MKFIHSLFVTLTACLLFTTAASKLLNSKVDSEANTGCQDSCKECQRAVYQLKFHGMADCGAGGKCQDTVSFKLI